MKRPIMGPDWSRLWNIAGKLVSGETKLSRDEARWLSDLLAAIGTGEDVSLRFFTRGKPTTDDRDQWIAFDIERLTSEHHPDPYGEAADRWGLDPESIERTLRRKKIQAWPLDVRVIDWHRKRFTK